MQMLDRGASGARYLSWLRKVLANVLAQLELNERLTPEQRKALTDEQRLFQSKFDILSDAYGAYHHFNENAFVGIAAKQRVANYLCDVALEESHGSLLGKKKDAEQAVPGILVRFTEGFQFNKALVAGHETTVAILKKAADVLSLLPDQLFPFANPAEAALRQAANRLDGFNKERRRLQDEERAPLRTAVERAILDVRETVVQANGRLRTFFTDRFIDSLYPELDKRGQVVGEDDTEEETPAPAAPTNG